jgi:hypothetical protein
MKTMRHPTRFTAVFLTLWLYTTTTTTLVSAQQGLARKRLYGASDGGRRPWDPEGAGVSLPIYSNPSTNSHAPSSRPHQSQSHAPSSRPSQSQSGAPSGIPPATPSQLPSLAPSWKPSSAPSVVASNAPFRYDSVYANELPSSQPSHGSKKKTKLKVLVTRTPSLPPIDSSHKMEHGVFVAATPGPGSGIKPHEPTVDMPVHASEQANIEGLLAAINATTGTTTEGLHGSTMVMSGNGTQNMTSVIYNFVNNNGTTMVNNTGSHLPSDQTYQYEYTDQTTGTTSLAQASAGTYPTGATTDTGGNSWYHLSSVMSNWIHGSNSSTITNGTVMAPDNTTLVVNVASLEGGKILQVNTSIQMPTSPFMYNNTEYIINTTNSNNSSGTINVTTISPEPLINKTYLVSEVGCRPFTTLRNISGAVSLSQLQDPSCNPSCTQTVHLPFPYTVFGTEFITSVEVSSTGSINLKGDTDAPMGSAPIDITGSFKDVPEYTEVPRISIAQSAIYPPARGSIDVMVYNSSADSIIISWESVILQRYQHDESAGAANFQVELFRTGSFELRWGSHVLIQQTDRIAAGIEDERRNPPMAVPALGAAFDAHGETSMGTFPPEGSCNLFLPIVMETGKLDIGNSTTVIATDAAIGRLPDASNHSSR